MKGDVVHDDAHEDNPASLGDELEAAHHRARIAGYIEDHGRRPVIERLRQPGRRVLSCQDGILNIEMFAAESKAFSVEVENAQARAGQLGELDDAQPDRPAADHEDRFSGIDPGAFYCMRADSERLDQGQLVG